MSGPTSAQHDRIKHVSGYDPRDAPAPAAESRYVTALKLAGGHGDALGAKLLDLVSAENIQLMTGFALTYIAAQASPFGRSVSV